MIGVGIVGLTLSLIGDIGTRTLSDRVDAVILYRQPIQMADVSLSVTFDPGEGGQRINHPGNYVAFLKGEDVVLVASHPMTEQEQSPEGHVTLHANLNMEEGGTACGSPLYVLRDIERIKIAINKIPKSSIVLEGKVTCRFNNAVLLEIPIPPQQITASGFIQFDISQETFADFTK